MRRAHRFTAVPRSQAGLSMLEVVVAVTLVVVVLLASMQVVTRTVAQVGTARTAQAERAARAKTIASQWLQAELEYLKSQGFGSLVTIFTSPTPPAGWTTVGSTRRRTITPGTQLPGETPLPDTFEKAVITLYVETFEKLNPQCTSNCSIDIITLAARVDLFRSATDAVPFVSGQTSMVKQ
ncbi:MAG: hypothetical protein QN163_05950 [Armatimonadota bacterium]|nr:hypothetical protein [Armatimonadota bacterium]